jgi:exosortase A
LLTADRLRRGTTIGIAVVLLVLAVLAIHFRTTLSMASIWQRSETYAHGYLVVPMFVWLVWRQREALASVAATPFPLALVAVAAAAAVWWLGERVSATGITQLAVVAMALFVVWAALGNEVARTLAFPLAFLFFAVPFGEFLLPRLMNWTADFVVLGLRMSGVPVFREGNQFVIPTGRWSVVEACSGLRYLIASLMIGSLFAFLTYRSTARRLAFIAVALAVPIVANWVRAYLIVMIGHLSDNKLAVGIDHLIYGWLFFGLVMAVLFYIGARWRETEGVTTAEADGQAAPVPAPRRATSVVAAAALVTVMAAALSQPHVPALEPHEAAALPRLQGGNGWQPLDDIATRWRPDVSGAGAELVQSFAKRGVQATLFVSLFRDQTRASKALSSRNQLVRTTNADWREVETDRVSGLASDPAFTPQAAVIAGGPHGESERLAVWQWFWVDGRTTGSPFVAGLSQVLAVAAGNSDAVAWVVIATPTGGRDPDARARLDDFAKSLRPAIDAALRQAMAAERR